MSKHLVVAALSAAFMIASPVCAQNTESVNGHFVSEPKARRNFDLVVDLTVQSVRLKNGSIVGRLKLSEKRIVDGKVVNPGSYSGPIDEMIISGNRAYLRSGNRYIVLEDGGEGVQSPPDGFARLIIGGGTVPLSFVRRILDAVFMFDKYVAKHGNLAIHGAK